MIDFRKYTKMLNANGYHASRESGSHVVFHKGNKSISVNRHLNKMVARRIVKENSLKPYDVEGMLGFK